MAGLIPPNPRTGNRLEYLAHYILSKFGTAVPVLRQEDVGVDFYCSLGKDEPVGITLADSYAVQLKSGDDPCLELGGKTRGGTWRDYELKWFLNLEFPLLFGVPYEKEKRLNLYATSLVRWITTKPKLPYLVRIKPGEPGVSKGDIHPDHEPKDAEQADLPDTCDGLIHTYHIGPPIVSCSLADLDDEKLVAGFQERIRKLLRTERLNTIYRALGLPYWTWVLNVETNKSHRLAYAYDEERTIAGREAVLAEIVPFVCALGLSYLKEGNGEKLEQLKGIASQLPKEKIPEGVRMELGMLFN